MDNQMGLIPMVIWAHSLGLTVTIKGCPDGDVAFGNVGKPQVIIKWSSVLFPQRRPSDSQGNLYGPAPIETANFAVSFSITICRVMRRVPFSDHGNGIRKPEIGVPTQCYLSTEQWRVLNASETLLSGIELDKRKISDFVDRLSGKVLEDMAIPTGIRAYLEKLTSEQLNEHPPETMRSIFLEEMKQLAS